MHLRVQKERARDPLYQAEVSVSASFDRGGFTFRVDGRMDGLFRHDPPVIEEIKSTASIADLSRRLVAEPLEHPYSLQLLTYGYFYLREQLVVPRLTFHLVSTRGGGRKDVELPLDIPAYEQWLDRRLDELVIATEKAEKQALRRRKAAVGLRLPFDTPRPGQQELIAAIEQGMAADAPLLIQAPTGMGKTAGVLFPVLKEAMGRGQTVVYVTPKNSQHAVAEDAVDRFRACGTRIRSLSLTAKQKICFKDEPLCNPDYCEYADDYYGKLHRHGISDRLAKKRVLKARTFRKMGEEFKVCPFELQLECAPDVDVIICDYNYVFSPRSALGRLALQSFGQDGKPNLIIDEAHNLPHRSMDIYSPSLATTTLESMRDGVRQLPPRFRREAEDILDGCIAVISSSSDRKSTKPHRIAPPVEPFLVLDGKLRAFLSRYLDADGEILPSDIILRLCLHWSSFSDMLERVADPERTEFFTTFHPSPSGGEIRITCCDASAMLKDCYEEYDQAVAFSATLKPFDYYAKLSGFDPDRIQFIEFGSPFPRERRKLLLIPQISTRYVDRERNYGKIADAVARITALHRGNYFVFLPSFGFLEKVAALFQPPEGFTLLLQERSMPLSQVEGILDHLRSGASPTIVLAVQGGSFSEGIDYAGEMVVGVFVVGPPLPGFDLERDQMREYYQREYGAGFDYAYTIPAMAKAVQAAGRVIRSETDRGLIVLMDGRFLEASYSRTMPGDWFDTAVTELVSDSILRDVADFWQVHAAPESMELEQSTTGEGG